MHVPLSETIQKNQMPSVVSVTSIMQGHVGVMQQRAHVWGVDVLEEMPSGFREVLPRLCPEGPLP